jgi:hypothetical protein
MGKPPKELLEEIQWRRIVKHMEQKPQVWGDVSKLNMEWVQDMLKTKSRYRMVRQMKLRWGLMATRHVMMIQRRVLPQENRCPLCSTGPDTNEHLISGCTFPEMQRIRDEWGKKIKGTLIEHSVTPEYAEQVAEIWNPAENEHMELEWGGSPSDPLLAVFVGLTKENGGTPALNACMSYTFENLLGELETKKPKKVAQKIWNITTTAVNEMWIARNKLEQVTRVKSEGLNERVKAIFDSGALKHLDITCDEVIRTFRTKKKAAFVARYERTSEEQEEDDAIDIDQLLKEALSCISQGDKVRSIRPTGEIMEGMITGVNPATGEAAVQYVQASPGLSLRCTQRKQR